MGTADIPGPNSELTLHRLAALGMLPSPFPQIPPWDLDTDNSVIQWLCYTPRMTAELTRVY